MFVRIASKNSSKKEAFSLKEIPNYSVEKLKKSVKENKDPFVVVVSDEKIISDIGANFYSEGSWKQDQITLQSCDLIVGPPSTFTMWASYISQVPLIKLNANKNLTNAVVCRG